MYGNNANLTEPIRSRPFEKISSDQVDSAYDHLVVIGRRKTNFSTKKKNKILICSCVAKELFSASPLLIYLLDLLRIPLKNSFNTFFTIFVNDGVDDVLADEENIIDVVHALRGIHH